VNARDDLHLGVKGTNVREAAAVDAHTIGEDASAHDLLRDRLVGGSDLAASGLRKIAALDEAVDVTLRAVLEGVIRVLALYFVGDLVDGLELVVGVSGDGVVGGLLVGREDRVVSDRLGSLRGQLELGLDELLEEGLGCLEALGDDGLVGLGGPTLDGPSCLRWLRLRPS
jgi:hypothetical protein